ncbi:uncharacterized protein [Amphiura filiformis]|uniref:uncharacterized protein n=1 Tax=Amphiura filiformis TaxID=82378 RepID=UPI003B2189EE
MVLNIQHVQRGAVQLLLLVCSVFASDPTVTVEQGQITGTQYQFQANGVNHEVDAYLGIPYAEAPVGPLRFKPPVPKEWKGELNAKNYGKICHQSVNPFIPYEADNLDEDCLILNVFVPQPKPSNAAVMFWIHGGGYGIGAGSFSEGMDLHPLAALGDVIVVSINYRLGAIGFLATGDNVVPGNMGMLDQVEAMKWVQKNIAAFGGNPDQVTIFGESAGAASISMHTLSPLSVGLFSRAIMQSGAAIDPWAFNTDTVNYAKRAYALGKLVGCNVETTRQLVDCLHDVPANNLINATTKMAAAFPEDPSIIPFAPVIDNNFLPDNPSALVEKRSFNRADIMSGYNADEGTLYIWLFYPNSTEKPHLNASEFEQMVTFAKVTPFHRSLQRGALELVYFDDIMIADPNSNYFDALNKIIGDYYFACSNDVYLRGAYEANNVGSVYAYYYNYHPSYSLINTPWSGACHADDLMFFGYHFLPNNITLTDVEVDMTMKMIQYWTNFAKTGDPNIASEIEKNSGEDNDLHWPQYTPDEKMHKELAPDMRSIPDPNRARCRVWNEYIPKLEAWMASHGEWQEDKTCKWSEDEHESTCNKGVYHSINRHDLTLKMVLNIQKAAVQLLLLVFSVFASDPTVTVEQGQIIGTRYQFQANGVNHEVDAYLGIPYAEAPVGPLRFKPPVPKQWQGELNAQQYGKVCHQPLIPFFPIKADDLDEDCLVLNVFVPQSKPSNAAVMLWIHGGAYLYGAGSLSEETDMHPVASIGDVIVVSINYRLGVLGFLATGDDVVPGNMGMLDQVEAMKWVQKNIAAFGGNPDRVTIFGESAGAGSVSLHTLSPLSAGLFSRAIMQSGVAIDPWTCNTDTANYAKRAFALGKLVGCDEETTEQLVDCLGGVVADDIVNATMRMMESYLSEDPAIVTFAPVVDNNFLPGNPSALVERKSFNRASIMAGYNADEGNMNLVLFYPNSTEKPHVNASVFEQTLIYLKVTPFLKPLQRSALELVYFDDAMVADPNSNYIDALSKLLGDYYFACPNDVYLRGAYEANNVGSVYAYYFNHHPSHSLINSPWSGACHADDLVFFGLHFLSNNITLTDVEVDMTMKMIRYWTNFAKTGNPNIASESEEYSGEDKDIDWPQYTPDKKMYQELAPDMRSIPDPNRARCRVWNEYIPKLEAWMANLGECDQDTTCSKWSEDGQESTCNKGAETP